MSRTTIAYAVALVTLTVSTVTGFAGNRDPSIPLDMAIDLAWNSRYVSEGRDNLDGEGLANSTLEIAYKGFNLGSWYASSPNNGYTEFNAYSEYTVKYGPWECYAGYTHLEYPADDADDDEIGGGLAYTALPGHLSAGLDGYYSFEAGGSFYEAIVAGEYSLGDLTLSPGGVVGANAGYIADGHDGLNNFALCLTAAMPIKDGVVLVGSVAHNWAIDADPDKYPGDELLDDFFHGSIALNFAY